MLAYVSRQRLYARAAIVDCSWPGSERLRLAGAVHGHRSVTGFKVPAEKRRESSEGSECCRSQCRQVGMFARRRRKTRPLRRILFLVRRHMELTGETPPGGSTSRYAGCVVRSSDSCVQAYGCPTWYPIVRQMILQRYSKLASDVRLQHSDEPRTRRLPMFSLRCNYSRTGSNSRTA